MNLEKPAFTIKTLDNYPRVLFWSLDEFLVMSGPFLLGIFTGAAWIIPFGLVLKPFYKKFKKKSRGSFKHRMYWIFPTNSLRSVFKQLPPSHHRELIL